MASTHRYRQDLPRYNQPVCSDHWDADTYRERMMSGKPKQKSTTPTSSPTRPPQPEIIYEETPASIFTFENLIKFSFWKKFLGF
ncbi:MAG TPA: hypothetical protein VLH94_01610 [Spirochaetia bacterium]|nr:hypothetical protein [Spirochaetia bacterium]